ncbi:MAG: hypothetical protein ACRDUY_07865 [Nitriliruptorales bacterium]
MAGRSQVLERRRRRIAELEQDRLDERVRAGLRQVWEEGRRPETIRVRPAFIHLSESRTVDGKPVKPPVTQLLRPRGIALRFYLLALYEAQCRRTSTSCVAMKLHHGDGAVTWVDLVAVDAEGDRRTKERRTRLDNRIRQVKGALETLHGLGMVEIPRFGGTRRFAEFTLMHEAGRGDLASPRTYAPPKANEAVIDIPVQFFLNGWVHVLQPTEIATWLMFRHLAIRYPGEHAEHGVYVYGDTREDEYGLKRDAYEGHAMLRELGLLRFAPFVSPDGTKILRRVPSRYDPHRFQLLDEGLSELAVPTVLDAVTRQLAQLEHYLAAPAITWPVARH